MKIIKTKLYKLTKDWEEYSQIGEKNTETRGPSKKTRGKKMNEVEKGAKFKHTPVISNSVIDKRRKCASAKRKLQGKGNDCLLFWTEYKERCKT